MNPRRLSGSWLNTTYANENMHMQTQSKLPVSIKPLACRHWRSREGVALAARYLFLLLLLSSLLVKQLDEVGASGCRAGTAVMSGLFQSERVGARLGVVQTPGFN